MKNYRVLIVEDERRIARFLQMELEHEGMNTAIEDNGRRAYERIVQENYDLVLLDVMLPDMDGFTICRKVRELSQVPIIMLTAKDDIDDKVQGLDIGADDYITKPFSLAVLRARVNAQLRRSVPVKQERIELNGFILDFTRMEFSKEGTIIDLSKTEQRLLRLLVENRGRTLPRELLLEKVWDGGEFVDENALSVAVRRLRGKLGNAPIRTVYGVGYTWEVSK